MDQGFAWEVITALGVAGAMSMLWGAKKASAAGSSAAISLGKASGAAMLRREEGFSPIPYRDGTGVSLGYGRNFPDARKAPKSVTRDQAEKWLMEDIEKYLSPWIRKIHASKHHRLGPGAWAALLSFSYNLGTGVVATFAPMINEGATGAAIAARMKLYHKEAYYVNGKKMYRVNDVLVARRKREAEAFVKDYNL